MRSLGKIKWFGTFNSKTQNFNNYGFIQEGNESIYFNKQSVLSRGKSLDSGVWVTYTKHEKSKGRLSAEDVLLLEDEENVEIFLNHFQDKWKLISEDSDLGRALVRYLAKINLKYTEQSIINNFSYLQPEDRKILLRAIYSKPNSIRIMKKYLKDEFLFKYLIKNGNNLYKYENNCYISFLRDVLIRLKEEKYWEQLNLEVIFNEKIWSIAPPEVMVKILSRKNIKTALINEITRNNIDHIFNVIVNADENKRTKLLDSLPEHIKNEPKIYNFLSPKDRLEVLLSKNINDEHRIKELEQEILKNFALIKENEKYNIAGFMPEHLKIHYSIFCYLGPSKQVNVLSRMDKQQIIRYWELCGNKTKIMFIFKNYNDIDYLQDHCEERYIKCLIEMSNAKNKKNLFKMMHDDLQNAILEIAWDIEANLDCAPLLPICENYCTTYCEGRPWKNDIAFCPRTGKACKIDNSDFNSNSYYHTIGARISPNYSLHWSKWSLLEYFSSINVTPRLPELATANEYTNRMAGWLNRLIEIRERLKCRICGKPLLSNMKYAKNLARYNATVFYCPDNHDEQIYISHCWSCHKIIDSRDCQNRDSGGFYVCTNCGSGSKNLAEL